MFRNVLTAAAITAFAALPATAQGHFGIIGGYVSSSINTDPSSSNLDLPSRSGFGAGLSLSGRLAQGVAIEPDAIYIEKGVNAQAGVLSGAAKLTYIEVPVQLKLIAGGHGDGRFFVTAGPQISFELTCKVAVTGGTTGDCDNSSTSGVKSTDFGVVFGAGVGIRSLSIMVRYDMGLMNINNDDSSGATKIRNRAIEAFVGIAM